MHRQLWLAVPIDDIVVCSCIDECWCYKPNPGMLFESAKKWDIQLASSYIVGDTWRDVGAGRAAGCTTILIDSWKYDEQYKVVPDHTAANLPDAAVLITRLAAALQQ
jgi:D-glycero-D-manno-heptose 1,7-bisphosphate phosphatase